MRRAPGMRRLRQASPLLVVLLAIEFLDEFAFGVREAAWPLIRTDLALSYVQVGILLTVPDVVGNALEPAIGVLGDVWKRRVLIIGGGIVFAVALLLTAGSSTFTLLLVAFVLFNPASGAFVSLSRATLMDSDPRRREQNSARWVLAGSVALVLGALAVGALASIGGAWRGLFVFAAVATVLLLQRARKMPLAGASRDSDSELWSAFKTGLKAALRALRRRSIIRWLLLLEFSDLMSDVLHGFLALYFVDVAGVSPGIAAVAVGIWSGAGLAGDLLLIPLLERVPGLRYLRVSVVFVLALYAGLLLAPALWPKLVVVGALGFASAGWYAILSARLYESMPGQSGSVTAVTSATGMVRSLVPLGIGAAAAAWGLGPTMWLLIAGPAALLVGLPRDRDVATEDEQEG